MTNAEERVSLSVSRYLELNCDVLLENWIKKVTIYPDDPYKDLVKSNGASMLNLVISFLRRNIDEEKLRDLAYAVSLERLKAKANIGDYVYNVNLGRSEIISHLPKMGFSIVELQLVIDKLNYCFDKFLYHTVHHFTELKNQLLNEQTSYIEQTHKDRLTILGQMASSFVHEFRNPLTSIIGFVQLLREKYPTLEYLDVLGSELNQLKFRINQFLVVSKKEVKEKDKERFNLSQLFEETLDFLYPMLVNTHILVEKDIDTSISLYGYRDEFRQVLINIIMNSLDALSVSRGKVIRIDGYLDSNMGCISISNNGPAIPEDKIITIFEPFVSTKELGTGIGLYICQKIIQEHDGFIYCESDENWTTFRIVLPISNQ